MALDISTLLTSRAEGFFHEMNAADIASMKLQSPAEIPDYLVTQL
jgi:hypothetical protein